MTRHHVRMAEDKALAVKTGARRGHPALLVILAERMVADGHKFYCTENKVWLTDHVPPTYLEVE